MQLLVGRGAVVLRLLLGSSGTSPATQHDPGLAEQSVDEPVGPTGPVRKSADAGTLLVLLPEVADELGTSGAGHPGAAVHANRYTRYREAHVQTDVRASFSIGGAALQRVETLTPHDLR
jgi:hypothetical protein